MTPFRPRPLITEDIADALRANAVLGDRIDPIPFLKLFNPLGTERWLITELMQDGDTLFGLRDLGRGFPDLGYVGLDDLMSVRLPYGVRIVRDRKFVGRVPLSTWAETAQSLGSIRAAEAVVPILAGPLC